MRAAPDGLVTGQAMRGEAGLRADLAALGIAFAEQEHRAVFTVAESSALDARIPGAHSKNLFLKDAGSAFWLVTVPAAARVDLKALPRAMLRQAQHERKICKRVSFAKAETWNVCSASHPDR